MYWRSCLWLLVLFLTISPEISSSQERGTPLELESQNAEEEAAQPNYEDTPSGPVFTFPRLKYAGSEPRYNYPEALAKSLLFYEAQRSGPLPETQRVKWRKDSALLDGQDNHVDLVGGYYDGAGYVKYGFPMASMTTILSWGAIRYRRTYDVLGQLDYMLDAIRWATDYFIKCHTSRYEFYGQVGNKVDDMQFQAAPQEMTQTTYPRKSYKIDENKPGTDLAAETAAALAAASIVFKPTDPQYSAELLRHAEELYEFADTFRGSYSTSIPQAEQAYRSGTKHFRDELSWGAAWLYRRTGDKSYLKDAENFFRKAKLGTLATEFSWNDKKVGIQLLLAEVTKKSSYLTQVARFCNFSRPENPNEFEKQPTYTAGGLLFLHDWGVLRYAANTAFICALAADLKIDSMINRQFAEYQINYMLGSGGRSYMIGFGENPPVHPFHKSSFCPMPPAPCPPFADSIPNSFTLYGALIGGPSSDDQFADERSNEKQSSVTIDFNAGFQSSLAALLDIYIFGERRRPHYDKPGTITLDEVVLPSEIEPSEDELAPNTLKTDYGSIVEKSLMFFEAQRSGILPHDKRIQWVKDSALEDGEDINKTLVGGYYDGFTNVKFGFPLCFSMTLMSWSLLESTGAYRDSNQLQTALDALKWGVDYIRKTHVETHTIVGQVGDAELDALVWDRPEKMMMRRPSYLLTADKPGTDLTAEMAASLAAASVVFRSYDKWLIDNSYPENLCRRAQFIFDNITVSGTYVRYQESIPSAKDFYPSSDFHDELEWASMWIYKCSKLSKYQRSSELIAEIPGEFSWDVKTAGVQLLQAIEHDDVKMIESFCNWLIHTAPRTPGGLLFLREQQPAKYAANAAFILTLAYKKFPSHENAKRWRDLAVQQIEYLAGTNEAKQSFIVGYGRNFPRQPQQKASSCPLGGLPCGFAFKTRDAPNPQELTGALVGGPDALDNFDDKRTNDDQSRVSLDSNAALQAAAVGLLQLQIDGHLENGVRLQHTNSFHVFSFAFTAILCFYINFD